MNLMQRAVRKAGRGLGLLPFAASGQDFDLRPFLPRRGYFVEAGANNGVTQSNTCWYERFRGWNGLLIEPIPHLAEKCRRNRPRSRVVTSALVPADYPSGVIEMTYCNLMSQVDGARGSAEADAQCLQVGAQNEQLTPYRLTVPARTLTSILDEVCPPQIDLLALDVEGYELAALQGLDMSRYRPTFLLIEDNDRPGLDAYLAPWYEPVRSWHGADALYEAR